MRGVVLVDLASNTGAVRFAKYDAHNMVVFLKFYQIYDKCKTSSKNISCSLVKFLAETPSKFMYGLGVHFGTKDC